MPKIPLSVAGGFYNSETPFGRSLPENLVTIQAQGVAIDNVYVKQPKSLAEYDIVRPTGSLRGWCYHNSGTDVTTGIYAMIDNDVYYLDGTSWKIVANNWIGGQPPNYPNSKVKMVSNGQVIVALDVAPGVDGDYFIYIDGSLNADKLNTISGGVYSTLTGGAGADDVHFFDNYFTYICASTETVFHGTLVTVMDGLDIRSTDFSKVSKEDDELTALFDVSGQLAVCSGNHIDFFQNVGNENFAFQLIKGQRVSIGVANPYAWCRIADDVMFYGQTSQGFEGIYTVKQGKISNDTIDQSINGVANSNTTSWCFSYSDDGQLYGVITATGDVTDINTPDGLSYSYNFTNKTWSKRSSRPVNFGDPDTASSYIYWPRDSFVVDNNLVFIGYLDKNMAGYSKNYAMRLDSFYRGDFGADGYDSNIYQCVSQYVENVGDSLTVSALGILNSGMQYASIELLYSDNTEDFTSVSELVTPSSNLSYNAVTEWRRLGRIASTRLFKFSFNGRTITPSDRYPYQIIKPYLEVS